MASASLSIPIAFWTRNISTAAVSATLAWEHYVVAGLEDGLIWVLKEQGTLLTGGDSVTEASADAIRLDPGVLLVGHNCRITALEATLADGDAKSMGEWILISASEDG
ncbi:hypothetical protein BGZ65_010238 [Modicella reniformis]|uniref:Uncharacterized protein n=1 Tax=Modicella reniformis TaxID=1440133 RepID=A0A9P6MJY8_9FUNG|nr:hypothetical protein BGZ65_010238 [Modicella reniformis]